MKNIKKNRLIIFGVIFVLLIYSFKEYGKIKFRISAVKLTSIYERGIYHSKTVGEKLRYRFYTPPHIKDSEQYPLVLILHGSGNRGRNNIDQLGVIASFFVSDSLQDKYPSFIIAPQCPKNKEWINRKDKSEFTHYLQDEIAISDELLMVQELLSDFQNKYPVDPKRIYVVGFSMGASGTWDIITRQPERFAAAIPISGISDTTKADLITHMPIWAFNGKQDEVVPYQLNQEMINAINQNGGDGKITLFSEAGHSCYYQTLEVPNLVDWLFGQKKD